MSITRGQFEECDKVFKELREEALYLSHYQLAQETKIQDPQIWKEYLMDPRTTDYINSEMALIRSTTINYMVRNAQDSNSVGQSQLINAITKLDERSSHKEGPAFVYCYVPLNNEQAEAPNVRRIHTDSVSRNEDGSWNLTI